MKIDRFWWRFITGVVFIFCCLSQSGCDFDLVSDGTEVGNPSNPQIATFKSDAELESYLKEQFAGSVLPTDVDAYDIQPVSSSGTSDSSEPSGFTETNLQEEGVDESDVVKTDGNYFYIAQQQAVKIVKATPADQMSHISTINVDGSVDSLYLYGKTLVILYVPVGGEGNYWSGGSFGGDAIIGLPYWHPIQIQTGVLLVDISDPASPRHVKEAIIDGRLVSSRLTGGKLHVVQQFLPELPELELRCNPSVDNCPNMIEANRVAMESLVLGDLVPQFEAIDAQGQQQLSGNLVLSTNFYKPGEPGGGSIVTITSFDLNQPDLPWNTIGLVADANIIYASTQSLYISATQWNRELEVDADISWHRSSTIHKFDLTGENVVAIGSGKVKGMILNQFSLGEYEDVLRVATTTGEVWNETSSNHLYCIKAEGTSLNVIGQIEALAPGERIYSARFMGDRGYLVTFVKVDPLFTLDLSDPTDPKVAGELKVPGFSDYIHPFGDNYLITMGKDTTEEGNVTWYQGLQLSIFDVSDFSDPLLLHKEFIGDRGTTSEALRNHKAFTFRQTDGLLAMPVRLSEHLSEPDRASTFGTYTFSGLYVYDVSTQTGFSYLGRIEISQSPYYSWARGILIGHNVYAARSTVIHSAYVDDIENTVNFLDLSQ